MYRQYEDPYELERQLEDLKQQYCNAVENNVDENILISLAMDINELEERTNFAWQDDENESEGY